MSDTKEKRRGTSDAPKLGYLIHFKEVRDTLGMDKNQMAERLTAETATFASPKPTEGDAPRNAYPVWYSRVHEWENGVRAVPDYAFIAYARTIAEEWKKRRRKEKDFAISEIDITFANLLHPAYGTLLKSGREVLLVQSVQPETSPGVNATLIRYLSDIEDSFLLALHDLYGKGKIKLPKLIKKL